MDDQTYKPRKSRVSKYPHGFPRNPDRLREIRRLRDEEKMRWRQIGPIVGISAQGACLLYNKWKEMGWFNEETPVSEVTVIQ